MSLNNNIKNNAETPIKARETLLSFLIESNKRYDYLKKINVVLNAVSDLEPSEVFAIYKDIFPEVILRIESPEHYSLLLNFIRDIGFFDDMEMAIKIIDTILDTINSTMKQVSDEAAISDFVVRYFSNVPSTLIVLMAKSGNNIEAKELYLRCKNIIGLGEYLDDKIIDDLKLFMNDWDTLSAIKKGLLER